MIVKIFANKGGGSAKASIDYLRGKEKDREGAVVLRGDPDLSQSIAESLEFKNKYTVGCLSFEEPNLTPKAKDEIMDKFEKTMFAGMEKDQYNISWIEHTDKGRLELNFFIPNVELRTDKRLQPYYDKADRPLTHNFQTVINTEYGLTNPDSLEKKQLLKVDLTTPRPTKEFKEAVHSMILDRAAKGEIKSQDNLVSIFNEAGLEVSRTTKKSISIKNPDGGRNIRFDGELYGKEFYEQTRTIEEFRKYVGEQQSGKLGESREDHERAYSRAVEQLGKEIDKRTEKHNKLYPEQSRNDSNIYDRNSPTLQRLGMDYMADKIAEQEARRLENSGSELQIIRAVYQSRADRTIERGGRNDLHHEPIEESPSIREQELHSDNQPQGLKGLFDELSRRTQETIQRTRKRVGEIKERLAPVFDYFKQTDDRTKTIHDSNREIIERKSSFDRIEESAGKVERTVDFQQHEIDEASQRITRDYQFVEATDRKIAQTEKQIERGIDQDRGWSMSR